MEIPQYFSPAGLEILTKIIFLGQLRPPAEITSAMVQSAGRWLLNRENLAAGIVVSPAGLEYYKWHSNNGSTV